MKTGIALLLIALLSTNGFAKAPRPDRPSPAEQVRAIPPQSPVEVRFKDGSKRRGYLSEISPTGFNLSREENHQLTTSPVALTDVRSVKPVASVRPGHTTRNILIGVGIGVAAVGIGFGIFVATHGIG